MSFISCLLCSFIYIIISLLLCYLISKYLNIDLNDSAGIIFGIQMFTMLCALLLWVITNN